MNENVLITVFTPTYNRKHMLQRVYDSLVLQEFNNFEWLIVDDGSSDNTREIIEKFQQEAKIKINYLYKNNGGKHTAINTGVNVANGALFLILDSDDKLPENALSLIWEKYDSIIDNKSIGGISGRKAYFDGILIGSDQPFDDTIGTVFHFRYKMKVQGDMCEVFKTSVLKEFPFPEIEGERFCPEALIWNRIGSKYQLYWTNETFYLAEYQPEGLTSKIFEVRKKSPIATTTCYAELAKAPISLLQQIRATINYWRFAFYLKESFRQKIKQVNTIKTLIAYPFALLMYINDLRKK